jgi:hypothetical protein
MLTFQSLALISIILLFSNIQAKDTETINEPEKVEILTKLSVNGYNKQNPVYSGPLDYKTWAGYSKSSSRIEDTLTQCYDCLLAEETNLNSFSAPSNNQGLLGGLAYWLNSPVLHSGEKFVSKEKLASSSNALINYNNAVKQLGLSCIVGIIGYDAHVAACEYGHSYCQITRIDEEMGGILNYGSCTPVCVPSYRPHVDTVQLNQFSGLNGIYNPDDNVKQICTTGSLSNKFGPICLKGNLASGSTGALPVACDINQMCKFNVTQQEGSCAYNCVDDSIKSSPTTYCSSADYGNSEKRGPLCYVGIFGGSLETGARLKGCGVGDYCKYSTVGSNVVGECSTTCGSDLSKCSQEDLKNKQGPICFVGNFFNETNTAIACASGQSCSRKTIFTPFGTSMSMGGCETNCVPSTTTKCCTEDLCNTYDSTYENQKCSENSYTPSYSPYKI